jgi:cell division protein FtsB
MLRYCIYIGLIAAAIAVQWSLWFGKGGYSRLAELQAELTAIRSANESLRRENDALAAEIESLENGSAAVEERARLRLGMIRDDEVLFRFVPAGQVQARKPEIEKAVRGRHIFKPKRSDLYSGKNQNTKPAQQNAKKK